MKFHILSLSKAKKFTCDKPWACVSIIDHPESGWPKINKVQQVDMLQLAFGDVLKENQYYQLFDEKQAQQILDFVDNVWEKIDALMIHCYAGISRSPAVAAAISQIKLNTNNDIFDLYTPNLLVYNTIIEVYRNKL